MKGNKQLTLVQLSPIVSFQFVVLLLHLDCIRLLLLFMLLLLLLLLLMMLLLLLLLMMMLLILQYRARAHLALKGQAKIRNSGTGFWSRRMK